jgi:N-acetyl-alpha-D-muramate 1-phosphate uridylyltransferase
VSRGDDGLVGVVLAAGLGTRLRPLTDLCPKPLCPVDNVALLDAALARVAPHVVRTAVNAHHLADQIVAHLTGGAPAADHGAGRVHVSVERDRLLGTAGALAALRDFIDAAPVLVLNGDAYLTGHLDRLVEGWDGTRPRLLVRREDGPADFGPYRYVGATLLPGPDVARLPAEPAGLYATVWAPAWARGALDVVELDGIAIDCGTPAAYLKANLHASGGATVVGPGAHVLGTLERCVVWPGARVGPEEHLHDCIVADATLRVAAGQ